MNQSERPVVTANEQPSSTVGSTILLGTNLLLFVVISLIFARVVPTFKNIYSDFGSVERLPLSTKILIWISDSLMTFHGILFVPFVGATIFMLVWAHKELRRRNEMNLLFSSLLALMVILLLLIGIVAISLFLPLFCMQEIVVG